MTDALNEPAHELLAHNEPSTDEPLKDASSTVVVGNPSMCLPPSAAIRGFSDLRLGTDLVFVPRLVTLDQRYGSAFFLKVLTPQEWAYCETADRPDLVSRGNKTRLKRAAARIAVKEAVAKALGCGLNGLGWNQGVAWKDIEVISQHQAPPQLSLSGKAQAFAERLGIQGWRLSVSHDGDYATATVIALI